MGILWWIALIFLGAFIFSALCTLTGRSALADGAAFTELINSSFLAVVGGVAGRFIWGSKWARDPSCIECDEKVPAYIDKDISYGRGCAIFSGVMTLIIGIYGFVKYNALQPPGGGHLVIFTGLSVLFLAHGLKHRSRVCALLLMLIFLLGSIGKFIDLNNADHINTSAISILPVSALIIWGYIRAIRGALRYDTWHKAHCIEVKNADARLLIDEPQFFEPNID